MSRVLTPVDVHAIVNAMVKQMTGQTNIAVVDTSTFISAGEKLMGSYTPENILNTLYMVLGKTIVSARPYSSPLKLIRSENSDVYTSRIRKISFYSKDAQAAGDWNTDLYTNFVQGYDNGTNSGQSTESMWKQNLPVPLELTFGGSSVWQDSWTTFKYQLKSAFRSEAEFAAFVSGFMTEKSNDIESQKESFDRATMLCGLAGAISMNNPGTVINMTELFNDTYSTNYSTVELLSTFKTEFLKFFVSIFNQTSKRMTHRSAHYHWSPTKQVGGVNYTLLRHTSYDNQRAYLFEPFFMDAKSTVLPEIFHDGLLDIKKQYQAVDFWQSENSPAAIKVKPVVVNKVSMEQEAASQAIEVDYVLGMICDKDYMMTDYMLDDAETTPMEARKKYYNTWYSMVRNGIVDYTENCVVFIMKDA